MTIVSRNLIFGLGATPVPVVLRYDLADPFAVKATFQVQGDQIVWTFSRDLLAQGTKWPVGEGDVRIWPSLEMGAISISLTSPEGSAVLNGPGHEIREFLIAAYELCQDGEESTHLDVDATIKALLN